MPSDLKRVSARAVDDVDLVRRAQNRDLAAFDSLVRLHDGEVRRIAGAIIRDADDADDVAQEVWLRVAQKIGQLTEPSSFRAWTRRIARNTSLNFVRNARPAATQVRSLGAPTEDEIADRAPHGPEGAALTHDDQRKVWETLGVLTERDRTVLRLRELDELDYAAIGEILGTTAHAAEVRSSRARDRFRRRFALVDHAVSWCRTNPLRLLTFASLDASGDGRPMREVIELCSSCRDRVSAMRVGRAVLSGVGGVLFLQQRFVEMLRGRQLPQATSLHPMAGAAPAIGTLGTAAVAVVMSAATALAVDSAPSDLSFAPDAPQVVTVASVDEDRTPTMRAVLLASSTESRTVEVSVPPATQALRSAAPTPAPLARASAAPLPSPSPSPAPTAANLSSAAPSRPVREPGGPTHPTPPTARLGSTRATASSTGLPPAVPTGNAPEAGLPAGPKDRSTPPGVNVPTGRGAGSAQGHSSGGAPTATGGSKRP